MKKFAFIILIGLATAGLLASQNTGPDSTEVGSEAPAPSSSSSVVPIGLGPVFPWNPEPFEFHYSLDSRFMADFTKEQLKDARNILEFDDRISKDQIISVRSTFVAILNDRYEQVEKVTGNTLEFNEAQLNLLRSAPYSADILIEMNYIEKNVHFSEPQFNYTTPHITVIPENQAVYEEGKDGLVAFLKLKTLDMISRVEQDKLMAGKIRFTVSKSGTVKDVTLLSTSGYHNIDERLIGLISNLPGKWTPAENAQGVKVDEQLVFSFGQIGC
jgi:hypothetical protein